MCATASTRGADPRPVPDRPAAPLAVAPSAAFAARGPVHPDLPLPASLDEVTADWLGAALRAAGADPAGRIAAAHAVQIGEGEGLIGDVYRLSIRALPADFCPTTLIAKLPTVMTHTRVVADLLGLYEREVKFYALLGSDLPVAIPRCYLAAMQPRAENPELELRVRGWLEACPGWLMRILLALASFAVRHAKRRYVLILEDLAHARAGDQLAGPREGELTAAIDALARLHARFWSSETLDAHAWIQPLDATPRVIQQAYSRALPEFRSTYGAVCGPHVESLNGWLLSHGEALTRRVARHPATLLHGDYRLDNLFFHPGSPRLEVVVCDWQAVTRGPGVYDLAYLLSSSGDADPERDRASLEHYHRTLVESGVRGYPLDACIEQYRHALLLMLQRIVLAAAQVERRTERSRILTSVWIERLAAHLQQLDPEDLDGYLEEDGT